MRDPRRAVVEQLSTMYATPRACMYGVSESVASMTDSFATSLKQCPLEISRSHCAIISAQYLCVCMYVCEHKPRK